MCVMPRESRYDRIKKFERQIKNLTDTIWPDNWQEVIDCQVEALKAKMDRILAGNE